MKEEKHFYCKTMWTQNGGMACEHEMGSKELVPFSAPLLEAEQRWAGTSWPGTNKALFSLGRGPYGYEGGKRPGVPTERGPEATGFHRSMLSSVGLEKQVCSSFSQNSSSSWRVGGGGMGKSQSPEGTGQPLPIARPAPCGGSSSLPETSLPQKPPRVFRPLLRSMTHCFYSHPSLDYRVSRPLVRPHWSVITSVSLGSF